MDDHTDRCPERDGNTIGNAVRDMDKFSGKIAQFKGIAGGNRIELCLTKYTVFPEPAACNRERQLRAVNWDIQLAQDVG